MARKFKARDQAVHQVFYDQSGWWLAAWRDYREMTLDALAAVVDSNKGQISALESGTGDKRYNRDWVEKLSGALAISPMELIGVNPYQRAAQAERLAKQLMDLKIA